MKDEQDVTPDQEPVRATRILFNPLALFLWLMPAAVALFAPLDVLDRYPFAATVVDNMVQCLPALRGHAAATKFPQVALLHATLLLLFLGPLTLLHWAYMHYAQWKRRTVGLRDRFRRDRVILLKVVLGSILFTAGLFLQFLVLHGDWSVTPGLATESRLGLAVMFGVHMWGCAFLASIALSYCLNWFFIHGRNSKDNS